MTAQADWIRDAPYVIVTRRIGETVFVGCVAYVDGDTLIVTPVPAPGSTPIDTVIGPGLWARCVVYEGTGAVRHAFFSGTPLHQIPSPAEVQEVQVRR